MDTVRLSHNKLSVDEATSIVTSPSCGAISLFVGTTRDNFENKKVVQLEYEAYDSMAEKVMRELCAEIRSKWKVGNIAMFHRLGVVPVCEASVIIAVSSEHRGEALAAVQHAIHALKAAVPIWKKEVYDDASGSAPQWKENKECAWTLTAQEKNKGSAELEVPPHLIQIKATPDEVRRRIDAFVQRKREDLNRINIRDFCTQSWEQAGDGQELDSCARVNAVFVPRKDSKSHLRVRRVLNTWGPQTRGIDPGSVPYENQKPADDPLSQTVPAGILERLGNIEGHLKFDGPVPPDIYARLKRAEDRILYLESVSPEYFTSSNVLKRAPPVLPTAEANPTNNRQRKRKKVYSVEELKKKLLILENQQQAN